MKMKKIILNFIISLICFLIPASLISGGGDLPKVNEKYLKWQSPSFFRGFNVLNENPKTQEDFYFLKSTGATIAVLGSFGWRQREAPYQVIQANIDETDMLVNYCRNANLHYVIAVRQGPGRTDVYKETNQLGPTSTIWTNNTEKQLYTDMLKDMAQRYFGDPLFAGINMIVEPNPLWYNFFCLVDPPTLRTCLQQDGINLKALFEQFAAGIRSVDPMLPLIAGNVQFCHPEYFEIIEAINDPYIIYDFHNYVPRDYSHHDQQNTRSYPGNYFYYPYIWQGELYHDKTFFETYVFRHIQNFQNQTGAPVMMGEFGLMLPQTGGTDYLRDMADIAIARGWHFALWDFRRSDISWNYELMGEPYWNTVLNMFNGNSSDLFLYNITVNSGQNRYYQASNSISAMNFVIEPNGTVIFESPNVNLNEGFESKLNSSFTCLPQYDENTSKVKEVNKTSPTKIPVKSSVPLSYSLSQNYPNPFNPSTLIHYALKENVDVRITVYDILGRVIKTLVNEYQDAGFRSVLWSGTNNSGSEVASGIYIYKIEAGNFVDSKKMLLIK